MLNAFESIEKPRAAHWRRAMHFEPQADVSKTKEEAGEDERSRDVSISLRRTSSCLAVVNRCTNALFIAHPPFVCALVCEVQ